MSRKGVRAWKKGLWRLARRMESMRPEGHRRWMYDLCRKRSLSTLLFCRPPRPPYSFGYHHHRGEDVPLPQSSTFHLPPGFPLSFLFPASYFITLLLSIPFFFPPPTLLYFPHPSISPPHQHTSSYFPHPTPSTNRKTPRYFPASRICTRPRFSQLHEVPQTLAPAKDSHPR